MYLPLLLLLLVRHVFTFPSSTSLTSRAPTQSNNTFDINASDYFEQVVDSGFIRLNRWYRNWDIYTISGRPRDRSPSTTASAFTHIQIKIYNYDTRLVVRMENALTTPIHWLSPKTEQVDPDEHIRPWKLDAWTLLFEEAWDLVRAAGHTQAWREVLLVQFTARWHPELSHEPVVAFDSGDKVCHLVGMQTRTIYELKIDGAECDENTISNGGVTSVVNATAGPTNTGGLRPQVSVIETY